MDHDDRVAQALDDFWKKMERWRGWVSVSSNEDAALAIAYDTWMDLTNPPGDPHKEWVDAEKMKPGLHYTADPVLVKTRIGASPCLGYWWPTADRWEIQPMAGTSQYVAESEVTHWRYMPKMEDDNG